MSKITTHVLDTSLGLPAQGVNILLEFLEDGSWKEVGRGATNSDGRLPTLLPEGHTLQAGIYRLSFNTEDYMKATDRKGFYPYVPIVFEITKPEQHHHVPLLLNPFGYSTYRGS